MPSMSGVPRPGGSVADSQVAVLDLRRMSNRKSKRTPEIEQAVLEAVADGQSLRKACEKAGIGASTWLDWCAEDKVLGEQYARARSTGSEVEFERLRELVEEMPPNDENGRTDSGWVAWKRLQIDTFKWQLSKKRPERYGDRIEQVHSGSVGLIINIDLSDKPAA